MTSTTIPYSDTGYFSNLICDYLDEKGELKPFYHRFPRMESFKEQIAEKETNFDEAKRKTLVQSLQKQYSNLRTTQLVTENITSLGNTNTFTITTGHQLNLFTGPLYFLYKIISVINLSEQLNTVYSDKHFVPVYWMATEDHDFDEINYFNYKNQKVQWNRQSGGAVGELPTQGLDEVLSAFKKELGASSNAEHLVGLFEKSYLKHNNLASATRYLGNELFKEYGLVIVDGNDVDLKRGFQTVAETELLQQKSFHEIAQTTHLLTNLGYPEQVHAREINLFYLNEGIRERIVKQDERYLINDTQLSFSKSEILEELNRHPERFSPNALLRPLYQEIILPNLCYVGGGGELAYWFQLKDYFDSVSVTFPLLLLRNSALITSEKKTEKLHKLDASIRDLFQKQSDLRTWYTKKISEIEIDFSKQKEFLKRQFKDLYELAERTDASFIGAVGAQEKKQLNGLRNLEKRLLKAQKRKLSDRINRLTELQEALFPGKSLQERNTNFSEFYEEHGDELITQLKEALEPLKLEFSIIEI